MVGGGMDLVSEGLKAPPARKRTDDSDPVVRG